MKFKETFQLILESNADWVKFLMTCKYKQEIPLSLLGQVKFVIEEYVFDNAILFKKLDFALLLFVQKQESIFDSFIDNNKLGNIIVVKMNNVLATQFENAISLNSVVRIFQQIKDKTKYQIVPPNKFDIKKYV